MTPAEKIAASKPPRNGRVIRPRVWDCKLKDARKALRLTLKDVSEATGINPGTVHLIEHGTDLHLTTARTLAAFFGKTVEALWPELVKAQEIA